MLLWLEQRINHRLVDIGRLRCILISNFTSLCVGACTRQRTCVHAPMVVYATRDVYTVLHNIVNHPSKFKQYLTGFSIRLYTRRGGSVESGEERSFPSLWYLQVMSANLNAVGTRTHHRTDGFLRVSNTERETPNFLRIWYEFFINA